MLVSIKIQGSTVTRNATIYYTLEKEKEIIKIDLKSTFRMRNLKFQKNEKMK